MSDQQKVLNKAVLGLFQGHNATFLTTIYCSLKFSWDDTIPTGCTNGLFLKINPTWFQTLSEKMQVTLLAHELWHVAFMHMARVGDRYPKIWNMAADYAINMLLTDNGYVFDPHPLMPGKLIGLHDEQYRGMTAEQIYDTLIAGATQVELPFGEDFSSDSGEPGDEIPEPLTPEEEATIMATVVRASTLEQIQKGAGTLPGDFTLMLDRLLNPKLRWETMLSRWLTERSESGYDWRRPNRRYQDVYLPSRGGEEGLAHLMWALDVSGSVTEHMLRVFNSELKGAKETYHPEHMTVVTFDHEIQQVWEFSDQDNIEGLEITGRGGTCMEPVFDMARKMRPTALVMFSDMECPIPPAIPGIPVLWLCFDDDSWSPPYGSVIHVGSTPPIAV